MFSSLLDSGAGGEREISSVNLPLPEGVSEALHELQVWQLHDFRLQVDVRMGSRHRCDRFMQRLGHRRIHLHYSTFG